MSITYVIKNQKNAFAKLKGRKRKGEKLKMKKFCISFLIVAIIILSGIGLSLPSEQVQTEYLRLHVRANSNLEHDQSVKYIVKDAVVNYLTPYVAECDTRAKADKMLNERLSGIKAVCDMVLQENGYEYTSKVGLKNEEFPTRVYGSLTLDGGFYDALIIELGQGTGDNWWCVVYPPLCFTGEGSQYVYRSKIAEVIDGFFNKEKK